ncbi:hypothetical protein SPRG_08006 [Saprolegnia parasitica CBS 223.65]|uniref:Uncharacterized protein n=1 Tax=Saprolegnia parasitica (strain CBS 223.65) TaxID=695850 RepID=A0A067CIH6_SAPPC|nr:hypothetical protein SPRG_08006 [Saprolegnia parasitica CBS 223.65]KDO26602.1 hypothetical protein SPRG_08006 [Saprolegnia parasitica CBS 223.65]|eukprot:XP_012202744.1 hypothetical protein SPRG_08006 [Saprolegnia parasitica CBS 223.65]
MLTRRWVLAAVLAVAIMAVAAHEHGARGHHHHHDDDHGHSHDHRDLLRPEAMPAPPVGCPHHHAHTKHARHGEQDHDHSHHHGHDHDHSHHHGHSHEHHEKQAPPATSLSEWMQLSLWTEALFATALVGAAPVIVLFFVPLGRSTDVAAQKPLLRVFLSFAAGGLLGDALLHLLPHSLPSHVDHDHDHDHNHGGDGGHTHSVADLAPYLYVLGGLLTFLMLEKLVRAHTGHGHSHGHDNAEHKKNDDAPDATQTSIAAAGYLNLAADFSHNFTDGLAIGATFVHGRGSGWQTTAAMLLHEVPHEIGDFAILLQSGFTRRQAMWTQLYTAVGAMVGTVVGLLIETEAGAWVTPFTAGGFIYIACTSVFPELLEDASLMQSLLQLAAMVLGIALMLLIALFE